MGTSRKAFLGAELAVAYGTPDRPVPVDDRLEGSVATAVHAARAGAAMVRVHDVAATVAALDAAGTWTLRGTPITGATERRGTEVHFLPDDATREAALWR